MFGVHGDLRSAGTARAHAPVRPAQAQI